MKSFLSSVLFLSAAVSLSAQTPEGFLATVQKNFPNWDANQDGILSAKELDTILNDAQTKNSAAAAAAALKRASHPGKGAPTPTWTPESIAAASAQKQPNLEVMYAQGLKRIAAAGDRALFATGAPSMETIRQGKLGDCFCLAPLGALVHRDPAQAAGMFALQSNGAYRICLGKKTVEVTSPTDAEIAIGAATGGGGIWVNLYEKAVGTARNEDRPADRRVDSPLDAERGGSAGAMLAYLTGHPITRFSFKFAKAAETTLEEFAGKLADLRRQLADATQQNRLMTCGTITPTTPGLTPNHAYAVLGYDAANDSVRLWNPHGQNFRPKGEPGPETGYPTANGIFQIPLEHFARQFSGMAFEVAEEKAAPAGKT